MSTNINKGKHFNKIVLGSSRAMQIGTPIGERVLNISVSGAVLEDYEKLLALVDSNSITYDTLEISAHGWLFNRNNGDHRYYLYDKKAGLDSIKKAFSWEYFWDNMNPNKYEPWDGNDKDFVVYPDGTIRYDIKYRNQVPDVEHHVEQALIWPFKDYYEIDDDYKARFENILNKISKDHVIELVLLPYHPAVYNELITKIPIIDQAENYYKSIHKDNVIVIGSYNPEKLGVEAKDFYDPNHLNEEGLIKMFKHEKVRN